MMKMTATVLGIVIVCASMMTAVYAMDPLAKEGAGTDTDRDGLTNLQEFQWSTDPNNPDSDNGGAYDGWEVTYETQRAMDSSGKNIIADNYHFNPNDGSDEGIVSNMANLIQVRDGDANANVNDPDNDGWNNFHEYLVGSDPTKPNTDHDHFTEDSSDPNPLVSDDQNEGGDGNGCEGPDCPDNPCSGPGCHGPGPGPGPDPNQGNGGGGSGV
jgi:hypothetical protein